MKYFLFPIIVVFMVGCGSTIIKVKDPNYQSSISTARGCGKSAKMAREDAKANLSSSIISNVSSQWESRKSRNEGKYSSSSKSIARIDSNFMIIAPKFLNHTIEKRFLRDDIHCIDAVIDNDSLKKYKIIATNIYNEIKNVAIKQNGKLDFEEKDKFALKIARLYRKEILKYNKISNFINLLGAGENFEMLSKDNIKNMIDGKPYLSFKVDGKAVYGKVLRILPIIKDESEVKINWKIDGQKIEKNILERKFPTPKNYLITIEGIDKSGYKNRVTKTFNLKNRYPVPKFELKPNKKIYIKGDIVQTINKSYDEEISKLRYKWNFGNNTYSNNKNIIIKFNKVGNFNLILKLYDNYNLMKFLNRKIRVEGKNYNKVDIGMTEVEISRIIGQPQRRINLNLTSKVNSFARLSEKLISNMGLESEKAYLYKDYWLIFKGDILKCMIYKKNFEKKNCRWYRTHKSYAIAK